MYTSLLSIWNYLFGNTRCVLRFKLLIEFPPMSMKIRIREVARSRGINTAYQLQKKASLPPSTAARLYRNDVKQVTLETLERLLEALDCDASELFVRTKRASRSKAAR
jgi:DNA-binding Xre family transcriptional regulator